MPPYIQHLAEPLLGPAAQTGVLTVLSLVALDLVIGVVGAVATRTFSSEKMRAGLLHKFTELSALALAIILDGALVGGLDLSTGPVLVSTCLYVGVMEVGSILELIKKYNPDAEGLVGWLTSFVQPKGK